MRVLKNFSYPLIFIILVLIDQLSKFAVSRSGWSIFLNNQFAFSIPVPVAAMYGIYIIILLAMSWYVLQNWKNFSDLQKYAWVLVYAGGASNILERVILGYVRDFVSIAGGILNFADFFILTGLLMLLVSNRSHSDDDEIEKIDSAD